MRTTMTHPTMRPFPITGLRLAALTTGLILSVTASAQSGVQFEPGGYAQIEEGTIERMLLADVSNDGRLDIVLRIDFPLGVRVALNEGGGAFGPWVASSTHSEDGFGFALGHVNGDVFLDAVAGNPTMDGYNLAVLRGDGAGRFSLHASLSNGSSAFPAAIGVADVNGDGFGDIVSNTFVALSAVLGDGAGGFGPPIISGAAGTVGDLLLADINGDGRLDTLQISDSLNPNSASSTLFVNRGNGDGTFSLAQTLQFPASVGSGFAAPNYALARLNNDDLPDLAVFGWPGTHTGPGGLYLLRNNGGFFQQTYQQPYSQLGQGASAIGVGDLNDDGIDDVIIPRFRFFEARVSDGSGGFSEILTFSGPPEGDAAFVSDLAGSRLPDVVVLEQPIGPIERCHLFINTSAVTTPGDMNCDGSVNPFDIQGFMTALEDAAQYGQDYPDCHLLNADTNSDGSVNGFDIQAFVELLGG